MTMPTREEILTVLECGSDGRNILRRITDALDGCVVVPKEPTDAMVEAIAKVKVDRLKAFARDGIESRGVAFAVREEYAAMLAAAHDRAENCEHSWATDGIGPTKCLKCGDTSDAMLAAANKENDHD
jgi:6-pyruvoyl-tetrahydropterin synthase